MSAPSEDMPKPPDLPHGDAPSPPAAANLREDGGVDICSGSEPVPCYSGPPGTLDKGLCKAGKSTCTNGLVGACMGEIVPTAETCNRLDDDCNGQVDDGPVKADDPQHCGRCDNACASDMTCCDGQCVNLSGARDHCGGCGAACTRGAVPGCCGGQCVDFASNITCGRCDNACGVLKLGGGVLCHCEQLVTGPACVGDLLGDTLQVCY
jgi:hypothetical protein